MCFFLSCSFPFIVFACLITIPSFLIYFFTLTPSSHCRHSPQSDRCHVSVAVPTVAVTLNTRYSQQQVHLNTAVVGGNFPWPWAEPRWKQGLTRFRSMSPKTCCYRTLKNNSRAYCFVGPTSLLRSAPSLRAETRHCQQCALSRSKPTSAGCSLQSQWTENLLPQKTYSPR
jgi:hypothetical protein